MNWFTTLLKSKISITIITPPPKGVKHSTTPEVIHESVIRRETHSNFRFVNETEVDHMDEETIWYFTQEYNGKSWTTIPHSYSRDKNKAMELHLKLIERGSLESSKTRTVLWEGLSKDETKTWVNIQM